VSARGYCAIAIIALSGLAWWGVIWTVQHII
jgi:hypothetical protein